MSESANQSHIRLCASALGVKLWRNNSGAMTDKTGRVIRYGLGNDSQKLNYSLKSSDLIGITPIRITEQDVGRLIGVFTAIEVKAEWRGNPRNEREHAQLRFINLVRRNGGIGGFAATLDDLQRIIFEGITHTD